MTKLHGSQGRHWALAAAFLGIFSLLTYGQTPATDTTSSASSTNQGQSKAASLSSLPPEAQPSISKALGQDIAAYHIQNAGGVIRAENAPHKLAADFTADGVAIHCGGSTWNLSLGGYGYGSALTAASPSLPEASENRVDYARGPVTEWYVNGPLGLEQGFTFQKRPGSGNGQPLTVALAAAGNLTPSVDSDGKGLTLTARNNEPGLRYGGLTARDAGGKLLATWMEARDGQILLRVNDASAVYPVVIDPTLTLYQLTSSDGNQWGYLGWSVAMAGNVVAVGAPYQIIGSNYNQGAVYVFVKPANGWTNGTQTAKLTASDGAANDLLGNSVSISGSTIVAGAPDHAVGANSYQGAVYVFVEPAGGWANGTQTAELTASDGASDDQLGDSVAVSGTTIAAGAPSHSSSVTAQGVAYVFVQHGGVWTNETQAAELSASDPTYNSQLGVSVATTGGTVIAGAPGAEVGSNGYQGAIYVFAKPKTGWVNEIQTAKLTASDGAVNDYFGYSVALSSNTAVGGAPYHEANNKKQEGTVYVFAEPTTGGWVNATQTAELTASNGNGGYVLGWSVAVSGTAIAAGSPAYGTNTPGAAYLYLEPKGGWVSATQSQQLTPTTGGYYMGWSVGLQGAVVVAGSPNSTVGSNNGQGITFIN